MVGLGVGINLKFKGAGIDEIGYVEEKWGDNAPEISRGDVIVRIDPRYFRPTEVDSLLGDPSYAGEKLGWKAEISVKDMCSEMVAEDLKIAKKSKILIDSGI